jgi:hypothetical protein
MLENVMAAIEQARMASIFKRSLSRRDGAGAC